MEAPNSHEGARQRFRASYANEHVPLHSAPAVGQRTALGGDALLDHELRRLQSKSGFTANVRAFQTGLKNLLSSSESFTKVLNNVKVVWLAFVLFCVVFASLAYLLVPNHGPLSGDEKAELYDQAVSQLTFECASVPSLLGDEGQSGPKKKPLEGVDVLVLSRCGDNGVRTREAVRRTWGFEATSLGATLRFAVDVSVGAEEQRCRGELREEASSPSGIDFPVFIFDSKTGQGLLTSEGGAEDPGIGAPIPCPPFQSEASTATKGLSKDIAAAEQRLIPRCRAALLLAAIRSIDTTRSLLYGGSPSKAKAAGDSRLLVTVVDDEATFVDNSALAERVHAWKQAPEVNGVLSKAWVSNWLPAYAYSQRVIKTANVSPQERKAFSVPTVKWPPSILGAVAEEEQHSIDYWSHVPTSDGSHKARKRLLPVYSPKPANQFEVLPPALPVQALVDAQQRSTMEASTAMEGVIHVLGHTVVSYLASSAHLLPLAPEMSAGRGFMLPPRGQAEQTPLPLDSFGLLKRWLSAVSGGSSVGNAFRILHDPALSLSPSELEHPWLREHARLVSRLANTGAPAHYYGPAPSSMGLTLALALDNAKQEAAAKLQAAEELKQAAEEAAKLGAGLRPKGRGPSLPKSDNAGAFGSSKILTADATTQLVRLFRAKENAEIMKKRHLLVGACGSGSAGVDEEEQD